jgi:DNA-binding transcriptional MerR regulator
MANKNYRDAATLNLKAVVRETGLKPDTLRAWERRYGLPQPERTAGGHRLYSQRDVEILKWLIDRQEEGLSISRAVDLWQQLQADGKDPLVTMPLEKAQSASVFASGASIDAIREEWIQACMAFDEQHAEQILTRAFALYPPDQVCIQVLMKGLSKIGNGWYDGDITVQQEHFASELAIRRVETLLTASPPPTLQGKILILCPPDEEHTFSPLLLTYLLRRNGRRALFLGANVPLGRLEHTISNTKPNLVILVAQQLQSAANLLLMANTLQKLDLLVAYGGRIFNLLPEIRDRIPGLFLGEVLEEAPAAVAYFLSHTILQNQVQEPPELYKRIFQSFQSQLVDIESAIWDEIMGTGIPFMQLALANANMAQNIMAALTLGEISFLGYDLQWIRDLLHNHDIPDEILNRYVSTYANAVSSELDHGGELISDYLISLLNHDKNVATNPQPEQQS